MTAGNERTPEGFVKQAMLGTRFADVRWVAETGSTNDDLAMAAAAGEGEQVLITDLQTAGRGRRNRVWQAPAESGVLMSVLLLGVEPRHGFWAIGAVALAACQTIGSLIADPCTLKWPNDVLIGEDSQQRKVAGILSQVVDGGVIVGIGLNVNWPAEVPEEMAERGTAVNRHLLNGTRVDRAPFAAEVLQRAIGHLELDREALRLAWKAHSSTIGQLVRVERESSEVVGIATDVGPDGALQISDESGTSWHQVGDVVHLRRAQ